MYETATARAVNSLTTTLEFVEITLPEHWDGVRTVSICDAEGAQAQVTVHPAVRRAFRRAAILAPLGLCTRIDLTLTVREPQVVGVYWEG